MLKDVLGSGDLTHFATIGLVIFVLVFLAITAWVLSRTKREVHDWSRIPLTKDDEPVDDRFADDNKSTGNGHA